MLKWLKQKPSGHHLRGGGGISSGNHEGSYEVGQNKIITDDPLATIQVLHPQQKKSKNKSESIYAVSRVNPLFEEEEVPKVVVGGGNHSGSSGYDSGSQAPSDDDERKSPHQRRTTATDSSSTTSTTSSFSQLSRAPHKHGQLFRDDDDAVVHSQAAILSSNGRPVLHIVEQNQDFVHSIAVSVGGGRPLSPINETNSTNPRRSYHLKDAIVDPGTTGQTHHNHSQLHHINSSNNTRVSVHPVPTRNPNPEGSDHVGVAQLVIKEPRYVQSIVIGSPGPSPEGNSATLSSVSRLAQASQKNVTIIGPAPPLPLPPLPPLCKKPSVTFSERVELLPPKQETNPTTTSTSTNNGNSNNGKVLITHQPEGQGHKSQQSTTTNSPPYRKPSTEQDSIVTESLLLLTSSKPLLDLNSVNSNVNVSVNGNNHPQNNGNHRLPLLHHNHSSKSEDQGSRGGTEGERKLSSSSSCSGGSGCGGATRVQRNQTLEDFSSSVRRNHPVKHILSNSGKSLEISQPRADHYSSNEYLDHHNNHHKNVGGVGLLGDDESSVGSDGQGMSYSETGSSLVDDEGEGGQGQPDGDGDEGKRRRRGRSSNPKSPFGGIADHYAAAKEIAKEIESYSNPKTNVPNGSGKTNSKKSIVRELLSGRGREALAFHTAIRKAAAASDSQPKSGFSPQSNGGGGGPSSDESSPRHTYPISNDAIEEWESVRVQQVYLKGRSWKEVDLPPSSASSSASSSSQEDRFRFAGQRVLSVIQQGQVHSNKKDTIPNMTVATTTNNVTTSSIHSTFPPSPSSSSSSKQQHLKNSIYGGNGHSSEGASSSNNGDDDTTSDSGNSTDRNSKGSNRTVDLPHDRRPTTSTSSRSKIPVKAPDPNNTSHNHTNGRPSPEESGGLSSPPPIDKVMIVTGDSQNMVVDLSGVPLDLREAIISGTALITLPDGLSGGSSSKKGGYTIVSLPTNSTTTSVNPSSSSSRPSIGVKSNGHKRLGGHSGHPIPTEAEMNEIKVIPSTSANLNVHQLDRGELYDHIFNSYKYGTKNKTQIWDVMQQSVQQTLIEGKNGKKKHITTILPFHPNQDVYKSPDFTMEGQRMERQTKKLGLAKKRRCACRVFGIFFFLAAFIGVLVTLSMIYTKGQRYFGSV